MEIHISKIIDWVKENSALAPDWEARRVEIGELVASAVQTSVKAGANIANGVNLETYAACKVLLQQLEAAEGSQAKNMFGQYAVPHLQNWASVLSKWEEKNVHVADCQSYLFRGLFFEYPSLTRSITATEKCITDITRRYAAVLYRDDGRNIAS